MSFKNINNTVKKMSDKIDKLKQDISKLILSLPDNPRIKRLGNNCFTMSSKDLGESWSPFFHDFKSQYDKIVEIIEASKPEVIVSTLEKIIKPSKFGHWYRTGAEKLRFHPEVIENIKSILY